MTILLSIVLFLIPKILIAGQLPTDLEGAKILYNFNDNTGTSVEDKAVGDGINTIGTFSDTPVWVEGRYGRALEFIGTAPHIESDSSIFPTGTQAYTFSFWAFFYEPGTGDSNFILRFGDAGVDQLVQWSITPGGNWLMTHNGNAVTYDVDIPTGAWAMYTYVYEGGDPAFERFYINDKEVGSALKSNLSLGSTLTPALFGDATVPSCNCKADSWFMGFRVWPPEEVSFRYAEGRGGNNQNN